MQAKLRFLSTAFLLLILGLILPTRLAFAAVVPNVVGQAQATAITNITTAGLTYGGNIQQSSVSVPAGAVISQNPAAGINVPVLTPVSLVVSSGAAPPTNIATPNVVGQNQGAAGTAITTAGLIVGAVSLQVNAAPAGTVISQSPAPGALLGPGSPVNLVVSSGPGQVAVPDVRGNLQSTATTTLQNAGLNVTVSNQAQAACLPAVAPVTCIPGTVSALNPAVGTWVDPGTFINISVISPTGAVSAPNVIGLPQNIAINTIQDGGLAVGGVTYEANATVPAGNVISQSVPPGVLIFPNASPPPLYSPSISIVVSTGPNSPADIPVPDVVNQTQSAAIATIQTAGFTIGAVTQQFSATIPAGTVISQSPLAGVLAAPGAAVDLVVSSGTSQPTTVPVPDVVGQPQNTAIAIIQGIGLTIGTITQQTSATVLAGRVISQSPVANIGVALGSPVDIVVSSGTAPPTNVLVPSLVGLFQNDAITAIQGAALTVGAITQAASATVPAGQVISQSPVANISVALGSPVSFVVSSGTVPPTTVPVPNVVGLTQNAAITAIQTAALTVGAITQATSATVPAGTVISQNPVDGINVVLGTPVSFVVSSGTAPPTNIPVPDVVGQPQNTAIAAIQAVALTVGAITPQASATVPAGTVISQSPAAGINVALGSPVNIVVSSGPGQVAVPNVVSLTQAAAITAIQGAGLTIGTITQATSATVAAGSVISQSPVAGISVALGSPVSFVVSTGAASPTNIPVPNVVNLTQAAAIAAIQGVALTVGTITQATSATVPAGSVISQSPVAGISVALGSPVSFVVSTGAASPTNIPVPNVVNLTQAAAIAAIQGVALTVGTITQATSATVPAGSVISQNPAAGINVAIGSPVSFVVSTGASLPTNVLVPNVVGQTQAAAIAAIQSVGLTVTVTTAASFTVPAGAVISQSPVGGISVALGSPVAIVVSTGSVATITVPNVVNLTQAAAIAAIQDAGLTVGAITQAVSATVPKGAVISQTPVAGIKVAPGSAVDIVVSSGTTPPNTVLVPNVVGQTQSAAIAAIQSVGLTVTVTRQVSVTIPVDTVISQNPVGGVSVALGSAVAIVVSGYDEPGVVPNVVGQPQAAAKAAIEAAGFKVGSVTLAVSNTPAGLVISQSPAGGSQVAPGSTVNLTVSSGAAPPPAPVGNIDVPDVIGLNKTAASSVIRSAGLSVGATTQKHDDTAPAGNVIDQSPAAGTKVFAGALVNITVSLGPAGVTTVPDVRGQPEAVAKSNLQNAGFVIGQTLTEPDPAMQLGNVIRTIPAAGTVADTGASIDLIVSAGFSQPQEVTVPNVTNQTVENAREILFATCLCGIGSITVKSDPVIPAGLVSGQVPAANALIGYNTTVNLFVSSGSQAPVKNPNVVGMSLADASATLVNARLKVGFVSRQTSNTVKEGLVISQNPLMTALIPVGWSVNLVVSLGPIPEDPGARPQTQVPAVINKTLAAATADLINAGLRVGFVANQRSETVPVGQVIRQSPQPDATVPVSSRVNLVISFGPYGYGLLSGPAYITNYAGNTVSIINPEINGVVDNLPTGISANGPSGIAVHPDGTKLYVANRPQYGRRAGSLSVIDLAERKVIAIIPVGVAPLGVAINSTGERVFVANEGSSSLSVINTLTNQPFIDLSVPNLGANPFPRGVAAHPNPLQPLVYVTNRTVNSYSDDAQNPYPDQCDALVARPPVNVNPDQCVGSLSILDIDLKTQVGSVAVGLAPEGVAVHPDGMLVYVANSGDRTVSVIETVFNRVIGVITLDEFGGAPQPLIPRGVAVSPDGNRLYVTDGGGNRLFVIDTTANHAIVSIVPVGKKPYGVAVSPDSQRVYVANQNDNTVSIVDGRSNAVIATIPAGLEPWAFGQFVGPLATVAPPTFNPPGSGTVYALGVTVTISSSTPGASIRYTQDGSTPTATTGTLISNGQAVALTPSATTDKVVLKAVAFKDGWADSEVTEATYTLNRLPFLGGGF